MPSLFEAAVFNFEDKMVCDGLIKGPIMGIGPNYKKQFNQDYQVAKKNKEVIERF